MTPRRVREAPVQVYLATDEGDRLARLAEQLDTSKSEVLRRGLLALERELHDPDAHPALRLIGLAPAEREGVAELDAAREYDRALADDEERAWAAPVASRGTRGR